MKIAALCIFLTFGCLGFSQNGSALSEKKSLLLAIEATSNTSEKVQHYTDLAWEYINTQNDSALIYANKAFKLSKEKKYPLGQAIALETKGFYHEIVDGNYEKASKFYFEGIAICEEYKLPYSASIYHTLGVMFHTTDSYENALKYYTIAYDLAKNSNDLELQKKCLINMGSVNSSLENFEEAKKYMRESLEIAVRKELDYSIYANLGNLLTKQENFAEAMPYIEKATEINPDNPDSELNLYFLLSAKAKSRDSTNMNGVLKRAEAAVNTVGIRDKSLLLRSLADYYTFTGNYKKALEYRDAYVNVFEEIKEKQRDETVFELEAQYETEKKQRELDKKEAAQKLLFWVLGSILVLFGFLVFFFLKNRRKNKQLSKQKKLLEATVDEKNVLLKETHHRVKNSFQIVSSLLYLQSENIVDKEAKLAVKEAQNRVRSMVLIHQKLYSKEQLVGISTEEYFIDLTKDIFESHQFEESAIKYSLNVEPLVLDIETITPLGLILNELITNVLKHAFKPVSEKSEMQIRFKKSGESLQLQVEDNGLGMPSEVKENSFGIQLIKALAKKLKATVAFSKGTLKGTLATIEIHRFNEL
ncbi:histidine kinase dimerization/phosphoacceptor domain -containing protein [Aequorivita todarodis]|uniref:tetratricopeptide repeat-containing sensor histidine kinase n=1 Tax=Aequorivita todarodis TaxID=2036821 RepID=UPI00235006AA|nr:histidine kinase dimerization/phosphoacceptor domain -containing protein [Aequorivita todarodis]MDC8002106.1 histidine kinase dimerization/phosphoacceptor domain -containing protein [Aequorivita todarodis]